MGVKEQVLAKLGDRRGEYCSGQELAAQLGVTRAAVWKAVKALQGEGISIDAAPNRGYALAAGTDLFSAGAIQNALFGQAKTTLAVTAVAETPSTNAALRALAASGAPEGQVLAAAAQTAGCGRHGRSFYSPAGSGVYVSILLRPTISPAEAPLLTTAAALAAAEAVEAVSGCSAGIKWVNDVLVSGRKVCGILTEAAMSLETNGLEYAVLGAGFDLTEPAGGFPPELRGVAGGIFPPGAALPPDARSRLLGEFLSRFWQLYRALPARDFVAEYRRRSVVLGQPVTVLNAATGAQAAATALSLDDDCRLLVRYEDGRKQALTGGELRVRLPEQLGEKAEK